MTPTEATSNRTAANSDGIQSRKRLRHILAAAAASVALIVQLSPFLLFGHSLFLVHYEFTAYRFFSRAAVIESKPDTIFVVQGIPMEILLHPIAYLFYAVTGPDEVGPATLDAYAKVAVTFAYLLAAACLLWLWLSPRVTHQLRVAASVCTILPFYVWPVQVLLFAPDYWSFHFAYYLTTLLFTAWAANPKPLPRLFASARTVSLFPSLFYSGWLTVGFLEKAPLVVIGALPLLVHLAQRRTASDVASMPSRLKTLFLVALTFPGFAIAILAIFFGGDVIQAIECLAVLVRFLSDPGHLEYTSAWDAIEADTTAPYLITLAVAAAFLLASASWAIWKRPQYRRTAAALLLWSTAAIAAYSWVLYKRPAGTTIVDFGILACYLIAAGALLAPRRFVNWAAAGLAAWMVYGAVMHGAVVPNHTLPWETYDRVMLTMQEVHEEIEDSGPVTVIFMPVGNHTNGLSFEEISLYNGRVALTKEINLYEVYLEHGVLPRQTGKDTLKDRMFPGLYVLGPSEFELQLLRDTIERGNCSLYWVDVDGSPATLDPYPQLRALVDRPGTRVATFEHHGLGNRRTINIATFGPGQR